MNNKLLALILGITATSEAQAVISNALHQAGIECRSLEYNDATGQYIIDLQYSQMQDLDDLAQRLREIDFEAPPASNTVSVVGPWGARPYEKHTGACTVALNLCHSSVTNVCALQGLPISLLWLDNTSIQELACLRGLPIKSIMIDRGVTDVAQLCHLAIEDLFFSPGTVTNGLDCLRQSTTIRTINKADAATFWSRHDRGH